MQTLRNICRDDPEALDLLDRATGSRQGERTDLFDNVQEVPGRDPAPTGNRADTALRRLRKDRPDLHERVVAGTIKPHRAMVEAGFRPKTVTVPADIAGFTRAALRHLDRDDVAALVMSLQAALAQDGET